MAGAPAAEKLLSVIIPAYIPATDRGASCMAGLLRAIRGIIATIGPLYGQTEIIVQDDQSPGMTDLDWLEVLPGVVKFARNPVNLGFAGNCNAGAARASGRYLLFLNQDAIPLPGWAVPLLETFAAAHAAGQRAGIVGPKLLYPPGGGTDPGESDARGGLLRLQSCGGWYDAANQPTHRYIGWWEDAPEANVREEVSWITGAVHCWDAEIFREVGGYDTAYRKGYFEDVDACCRVQTTGALRGTPWRVWYCPSARFLHGAGSSGGVDTETFQANAHLFWSRWVVTKRVSPDTQAVLERWWA